MLEINQAETEKKDELIKELNIYTMLVEKVINYVKNPELVIAEMIELNHTETKPMFENIQTGLKGEFTKQRAIELGKITLIGCVTKQAYLFANKYFKLKETSELASKTLNDKINVMNETCSIDQILIRQEKYMSTLAGKEWVVGKLNKLVNNSEFGDVSETKIQAEEFIDKLIYKLTEKQAGLLTVTYNSELKEAIKTHETQFAVLGAASGNNSIVALHDALLEELTTVDNGDSVEINLVDFVKKTKTTTVNDDTIDVLELLNKLIIVSKTYQAAIINSISKFTETVSDIIDTDDTCADLLTDFRINVLEKYTDGKLQESDILTEANKHTSLIRSHIVVDNDLLVKILSNGNYINACISIYFSVYDLLDKVTLVGTIVETAKPK